MTGIRCVASKELKKALTHTINCRLSVRALGLLPATSSLAGSQTRKTHWKSLSPGIGVFYLNYISFQSEIQLTWIPHGLDHLFLPLVSAVKVSLHFFLTWLPASLADATMIFLFCSLQKQYSGEVKDLPTITWWVHGRAGSKVSQFLVYYSASSSHYCHFEIKPNQTTTYWHPLESYPRTCHVEDMEGRKSLSPFGMWYFLLNRWNSF